MKKVLGVTGRIFLGIIVFIISVFVLVIGGLNVAKFAIYSDYYSVKSNVCKNPGLGDGFVCQGVCAYEEGEKFFVSGYMNDGSASRIYVTDKNDDSYYVTLSLDGKKFDAHAGGIAVHADKV